MVRRLLSLLLLLWLLGFVWFAFTLPRPHPEGTTDAAIVLTGGRGRVERGISLLAAGRVKLLLVSGVDRQVKPGEFQHEYAVPPQFLHCCVTLGFAAFDTRSNAGEAARWVAQHHVHSLRLVTSDWHMRRARFELGRALPARIIVVEDAVPTEPSLRILFLEYNKLLLRWAATLWGG